MRGSVFYKMLFGLSQLVSPLGRGVLASLVVPHWPHDLRWPERSSKHAPQKETKLQLGPFYPLHQARIPQTEATPSVCILE